MKNKGKHCKHREEEISAILAEAETLGDADAAKRHGISERTIRRYRKASETRPKMAEGVRAKKRKLSEHWLTEAKAARMAALQRGLELVEKSENLREVTGFLKIVHDAVLADEMLNDGSEDGELDRSGAGVGGTQATHRQVAGVSTTTH